MGHPNPGHYDATRSDFECSAYFYFFSTPSFLYNFAAKEDLIRIKIFLHLKLYET